MLIQIFVLIFCFFVLWHVILKFRKRELNIFEFLIWLVFWSAVGIAFIIPEFFTKVANILGIGRGADLVLYIAVIVVFYLIFRIFVRIEKMERNITKIVRKKSIDNLKNTNN